MNKVVRASYAVAIVAGLFASFFNPVVRAVAHPGTPEMGSPTARVSQSIITDAALALNIKRDARA